jgi:hypothetical protein
MDVAIDLSELGHAKWGTGDRKGAIASLGESVQWRREIVKANPDDARALDRLAWATAQLGIYKTLAINVGAARADLVEAEALYAKLRVKAPFSDVAIGQLARVKLYLGEHEMGSGSRQKGCALLNESITLYSQYKNISAEGDTEYLEEARRGRQGCGASR